jgi:hypothetical protein
MRRITLEQQSACLAKRKRELGLSGRDYVPANSGARHTAASARSVGLGNACRRSPESGDAGERSATPP